MWIERDLYRRFTDSAAQPIKILIGMRQTGKSAFLEKLKTSSRLVVTFDDLGARTSAMNNPKQFLKQLGAEFVIDEAHYVPEIFSQLKIAVDQWKTLRLNNKNSPQPSYWLTGSNRVLLDKNVAETLTGRAQYFKLHTLSISEIFRKLPDTNFADFLIRGGWPELYVNRELSPVTYLNDYIQTSLEKDIAAIGIEKVFEFTKLLRFVAARVGRIFDATEVSRDASVKVQTVQSWLQFAARMMILHRVEAYTSNLTTRLIKSPKYYFLDTGLAVRLQGWSQVEPLLISPSVGFLFENLVLSEIVKLKDYFLSEIEIFHWRTKDGEEVDFILTCNGKILAVEAKLSHSEAETTKLPKEIKKIPNLEAMVVSYLGPESFHKSQLPHVSIFELREKLQRYFAA